MYDFTNLIDLQFKFTRKNTKINDLTVGIDPCGLRVVGTFERDERTSEFRFLHGYEEVPGHIIR